MTNMVERVARAICDVSVRLKYGQGPSTDKEWASLWADDKQRPIMIECARAAIATMREPTEVMITAADEKERPWGYADNGGREYSELPAEDVWRTMIDEALK